MDNLMGFAKQVSTHSDPLAALPRSLVPSSPAASPSMTMDRQTDPLSLGQALNQYQQGQGDNQQQQQGGGNPYEGSGDSFGGGQGGFGGGQNEYGQQSDFTGGRMHVGQGGGDFGIQGGSQFNSSDNRPPGQSGGSAFADSSSLAGRFALRQAG